MRSPHVNVPAPSVTGVFQTVSVQVEHPQWVTAWEGVGFNVGSLEDTEVVGCLLGDDDGWSVGDEVGLSEGEALGSAVGFFDGGAVGGCDGASVSIHEVGPQRHRSGNSDETFPQA